MPYENSSHTTRNRDSRKGLRMPTGLFRLDGKAAMIPGGSGGIGSTLTDGLCEAGARVAIVDRDGDGQDHLRGSALSAHRCHVRAEANPKASPAAGHRGHGRATYLAHCGALGRSVDFPTVNLLNCDTRWTCSTLTALKSVATPPRSKSPSRRRQIPNRMHSRCSPWPIGKRALSTSSPTSRRPTTPFSAALASTSLQ